MTTGELQSLINLLKKLKTEIDENVDNINYECRRQHDAVMGMIPTILQRSEEMISIKKKPKQRTDKFNQFK